MVAARHPEYRLLADRVFRLGSFEIELRPGETCEYFAHSDTYLFKSQGGVTPFVDGGEVESSPAEFAPVQYYILQGGAELIDSFRLAAEPEYADYQWFWTVPKGAAAGESGFIYLCAPVSRIVGRVEIAGEPFFNAGDMFKNEVMKEKWCAEIAFRAPYEPRPELTFSGLRKLFLQDWNWLRYPRGNTKLPPRIWKPFFEMTRDTERVVS